MSFTDDDLKRLKEIEDESCYRFQVCKKHDRWVTLRSLLARLEAAKACADSCNVHSLEVEKLYDIWRKSKGE
jgi:hypothetical protein